ncbi:MAG: hypothetical protein KDD66_07790 [Bdellovibrionales bacterium]|nr:hypothetical protein [Bdellovibrionales bacterium]
MVTTILNADPAAIKAVKLTQTPSLAQILPALNVGDSLSFSVRQNLGNGRGTISIDGQQVTAELPANLKAGDVVEAAIEETGQNVVLKILNVGKPLPAARPALQDVVAKSIENLTRLPKAVGTGVGAEPVTLDEALSHHRITEQQVHRVLSKLGEAADLQNPTTVLAQVLSATKGEMAGPLKEAAAAVKELVAELSRPVPARVANALHIELIQLQKAWPELEPNERRFALEKLIGTLERNLDEVKQDGAAKVKNALVDAASEMVKLVTETHEDHPPARLSKLINSLETQLNNLNNKDKADPSTLNKLQDVSMRLEQMAATQEVLSQLNPVMQALGEPALVLFPFLFQGFLTHSQVTLEAKKPWGKTDENGKNGGGRGGEPFQRIQLSVPLPSLGSIGVDVAHRPEEILVRITAPDANSAGFIESRLEGLGERLRTIGFKKTELSTAVGEVVPPVPEWSGADADGSGIIA